MLRGMTGSVFKCGLLSPCADAVSERRWQCVIFRVGQKRPEDRSARLTRSGPFFLRCGTVIGAAAHIAFFSPLLYGICLFDIFSTFYLIIRLYFIDVLS
jgi:hypothetical protein